MDDLLGMSMDKISDELSKAPHQQFKNNGRKIDPFNHYEIESHGAQTLLVTEDFKEASIVFAKVETCCKALIHVVGRRRTVLLTNAPYQYPILDAKKLDTSEKVRRHVIES